MPIGPEPPLAQRAFAVQDFTRAAGMARRRVLARRGSVNAEPQSVVSGVADAIDRAVSETANRASSEVQVSATNGVPEVVTRSRAEAPRFDSAPSWLLAHGVIRASTDVSNVHSAAHIFGARKPWREISPHKPLHVEA